MEHRVSALSGDAWVLSLGRVVVRNRRRYGGYVVHVGVILAFVSIAASSSFQTSDDIRMLPGDSATVDDYEITYVRPTAYRDEEEDRLTFGSVFEVRRDGELVDTLHAEPQLLLVELDRDGPELLRRGGDIGGRPLGRGRRRLLDRDAPRPDRAVHRRPDHQGRQRDRRDPDSRGAAGSEHSGRARGNAGDRGGSAPSSKARSSAPRARATRTARSQSTSA